MGGGGTTTTNQFDTRVTDPFTQYGMDDYRGQTGQNVWDASMAGLGSLQNMAMGNFGGVGGGGGGGGVGGIMGLGKYAQALGNDVFSDEFSQKLLNQNLAGVQSMRERSGQQGADMARSAGISRDSPAFLRMQQRIGRGVDEMEAGNRQQTFLQQAMEQLTNQRMQAQQESQLRGISRSAQGQERAARTGANASMYNSRLGAMSGAAQALGSGQAWRNFGSPYDVSHLNTQQDTQQNMGFMDYLGGGLGLAGSVMGMPGMPGGGGKGGGGQSNGQTGNPATHGTQWM